MNLRRAAARLAAALVLLAGLETAIATGLSHPDWVGRAPRLVRVLMRGVYLDGARNVIQFEQESSRYDDGLTYTLKPGSFEFSNFEFRTAYQVNSAGVRGRENDLVRPELIVLGDSRAMGWGVGQDETYAELLRGATGLNTLNASVSSFGTAREMKLLRRLDKSELRRLIIHYVENDDEENEAYRTHGGSLPISPEATYLETQRRYLKAKRYVPGEYTLLLFRRVGAELRNTAMRLMGRDRDTDKAVKNFLNVVSTAADFDTDRVKLVFLGDGAFARSLREEIGRNAYPEWIRRAAIVDEDAPEDAFFVLDNHMNSRGHRLLAERLLPIVQGRG